MIITLKDNHKSHLLFLLSQTTGVLQDFCKLATEYLTKGCNIKLYQNASQKLGVEAEVVFMSVEGLVNLLIECCKHQLSDLDLRDTLLTAGFTEEHCEVLHTFYHSQQAVLTQVLAERTVDFPRYKDLEWRLEAEVESRALLQQMTPQVLMRLSLESGMGEEHLILQADPANLTHLADELEAAVNEAKSQHFRRIQRRFK